MNDQDNVETFKYGQKRVPEVFNFDFVPAYDNQSEMPKAKMSDHDKPQAVQPNQIHHVFYPWNGLSGSQYFWFQQKIRQYWIESERDQNV